MAFFECAGAGLRADFRPWLIARLVISSNSLCHCCRLARAACLALAYRMQSLQIPVSKRADNRAPVLEHTSAVSLSVYLKLLETIVPDAQG